VTRAASLALGLLVVVGSDAARAQQPAEPVLAPELRVDVIAGHQPAVQVGGGVQIPFGYYVRLGIDGAVGRRLGAAPPPPASSSAVDARADLLVRFLLDPFRQTAYGLSVGGGMSLRADSGDRARPLLLVAAELEGRRSALGIVPAVQLGLGGGVRVGILLRRGAPGGR
jgi:hypothetical protein